MQYDILCAEMIEIVRDAICRLSAILCNIVEFTTDITV